jgi:hypothetical protein
MAIKDNEKCALSTIVCAFSEILVASEISTKAYMNASRK